jgi:hypothetical protein
VLVVRTLFFLVLVSGAAATEFQVSAREVERVFAHTEQLELRHLRALLRLDTRAPALGHRVGSDYAFAAFRDGTAQRSIAVLLGRTPAVVTYDLAPESATWRLAGSGTSVIVRPVVPAVRHVETTLLHVLRPRDAVATVYDLSNIDVAGVGIGEWAVLFHADVRSARSALSFQVEPDSPLRILVTGLAPGTWEVWRNGWLDEPEIDVSPRAGCLYLQSGGGSYFLRRRS